MLEKALNIKSRETEQLVRELAKRTGLSITEAVHQAAIEKLKAIETDKEARKAALRAIIDRARKIPRRDRRTDDEIVGYNEKGAFDWSLSIRRPLPRFFRQSRKPKLSVTWLSKMARLTHQQSRCSNRASAGLNLGDCASYALAKSLGAPLLFKGNDFPRTDVHPAL